MLISPKASSVLASKLGSGQRNVYCRSLFLSARWFVLSQVARKGLHFVILPDKESAEYCTSDLYGLVEGDRVFLLPESGKNVERSNYKSSLAVQRTAAVREILSGKDGDGLRIIVSYPEAVSEYVPSAGKISSSILKISPGDEMSHESIIGILYSPIRTTIPTAFRSGATRWKR